MTPGFPQEYWKKLDIIGLILVYLFFLHWYSSSLIHSCAYCLHICQGYHMILTWTENIFHIFIIRAECTWPDTTVPSLQMLAWFWQQPAPAPCLLTNKIGVRVSHLQQVVLVSSKLLKLDHDEVVSFVEEKIDWKKEGGWNFHRRWSQYHRFHGCQSRVRCMSSSYQVYIISNEHKMHIKFTFNCCLQFLNLDYWIKKLNEWINWPKHVLRLKWTYKDIVKFEGWSSSVAWSLNPCV